MNEDELPPIDEALVRELDKRFPAKYPDLATPDREVWYRAGQRALVDYLIEHYRKQNEDDLD